MFKCAAVHAIPKLIWCTQFLGVQKISVDTADQFSVLSLNSKKSVYLCSYSIISATPGSADTYFCVGMSLLPAKR